MTPVKEFSSETEARIFVGWLESQGVKSQIQGSREYTTIVLGGTGGRFKVVVDDKDIDRVRKILLQPVQPESPSEVVDESPRQLLKKAIFLGFCGMLIAPVIFHIFSAQKFLRYWQLEPRLSSKFAWLIFLLTIYAASAGLVYIVLSPL